MASYVAGDAGAFEELFRRLAPRVHAFFLRSMRDPAVADDLLQVTFMKVHRARAQYRPELRVVPWLLSIAGRVRIDEWRKRLRLAEDADEEALARADEQLTRDAEPPASNDVAGQVRAALDSLPESQRTVIHLHRYEGLTFAEIARTLGTTPGAVKLRAFRGYERLRELLKELA
jgi:RNA polymerase sigma factor (sigma-70 family)